jgi:hypothetical protein
VGSGESVAELVGLAEPGTGEGPDAVADGAMLAAVVGALLLVAEAVLAVGAGVVSTDDVDVDASHEAGEGDESDAEAGGTGGHPVSVCRPVPPPEAGRGACPARCGCGTSAVGSPRGVGLGTLVLTS